MQNISILSLMPPMTLCPPLVGMTAWADMVFWRSWHPIRSGKRAWDPFNNSYCDKKDIDFGIAFTEGAIGAIPTGKVIKWFKFGREFRIGKKGFRIAPLGNRRPDANFVPHPTGRWPHYHQPGPKLPNGGRAPGHSPGRHRPWDKSTFDKDMWDRIWPKGVWPR